MPKLITTCSPALTIAKKSGKYLTVLFLFFVYSINAQENKLTMEDAMVKNRTTLATPNLRQLQFVYGTEDYVYLDKKDGKDVWMRGSFKVPSDQVFLSLDDLNAKLKAGGAEPISTMPAIQFNKGGEWINKSLPFN